MKFSSWRRSIKVENEYLKSLNVLCDMFLKIAKAAGTDKETYVKSMNQFQNSYQYNRYVESIVRRMVTPIFVANEATWRKAARKSSKGDIIYRALMEEMKQGTGNIMQNQIMQNAQLIKTLPNNVAQKVVADIEENALKGKRAKSIEKIIVGQTNQHARASARLIARTEVSKTSTALTYARSQQLDLRWYVWRTSLDGDRVRKSHRNMEGVIINWNNPPSPELLVGEKSVGNYHAGNIWNCRCYPEPLIDIDDVNWPHKVYLNGTISYMGKREFEQIM